MLSNPFERDFLKITKIISHQKNHAILIKQLVTAKHMTKSKNKTPAKISCGQPLICFKICHAIDPSGPSTECGELLLAPEQTVYRN